MCSSFLSKYRVQGKLGEGTFSDVFKCENMITGEVVAVKKLKKEFKERSDVEYLSELRGLQKISDHKNVLTLLEYIYDSIELKLYMVFEVMDMSLYDLILAHTRCLSETKVKHMFYQLLKGVDHLHSSGIFHRDIKPENILVKKSIKHIPVVKLADLGSVRGIQSKPPYTDYISTRWYRAPECMLSAGFYSSKVDIWACGCVYYEMLTSKPIFPGANDIDQLTKIHQILGTPNSRVINKIRHCKSRVGNVKFAMFPGTNLVAILPFTSDGGREILKRMLVYDPDARTNVRRVLEHRYFNDLRENNYFKQFLESSRSTNTFPVILSNSKMMKNNKSCNSLQTVKMKRTEMNDVKIKEVRGKLSAMTWAPSSNATKSILQSGLTKSKDSSLITRHRYNPSTQITLLKKPPPDKKEKKQPLKNIKTTKIGAQRILPTIRTGLAESVSQISELCYKPTFKNSLPPIIEL